MRILIAGLVMVLTSASVLAASPSAQRGLTIARTYCARCHSIDKVSESPLKIAPATKYGGKIVLCQPGTMDSAKSMPTML